MHACLHTPVFMYVPAEATGSTIFQAVVRDLIWVPGTELQAQGEAASTLYH